MSQMIVKKLKYIFDNKKVSQIITLLTHKTVSQIITLLTQRIIETKNNFLNI